MGVWWLWVCVGLSERFGRLEREMELWKKRREEAKDSRRLERRTLGDWSGGLVD
jgi:hypothetical protein